MIFLLMLLQDVDRIPMMGYYVRTNPVPELWKVSDRHTHWGHSQEPHGSLGKIVPANAGPRQVVSAGKLSYGKTTFTFSRHSPAVWMESQESSLTAFKPKYIIYPTTRGTNRGTSLDGSQLAESWILVGGMDYKLSFVPSFLHCAPNQIDKQDYEKFVKPQPADAPILIVFQRRPTKISIEDGLKVEFAGPSDMTAFLPIGGFRWYRAGDISADRCSQWNRYLKFFPESFEEKTAVEGDVVRMTTRFTFRPIEDDWKTQGVKFAPVAPWIGLALISKLPHLSTGKFVDPDYPTLTGELVGFENTDSHTITFSGWKQYTESQAPKHTPNPRVQAKLEEHLRDMIQAGHLAPYESFQGTMQYSFWGNPADLATTLAAARRHVKPELQKQINEYLRVELEKYPILKYGWMPQEGARRQGHPIDLSVKDVVGRRRKEEGPRIENLYAMNEAPPDVIRRIAHSRDDRLDWELGFHKGGVHDLNARIKGLLGHYRLTKSDEAAILLVQALINRFAFSKLSEHRFSSNQFFIPPEFDLPRFHARNAHKFNVFLPAYKKGANYRTAPQVGYVGVIDRYLSEIGNFWHDHSILCFADLTPPLAKFLADTTMPELKNYMACIEEGLPTWYVAKAENLHAIGEDAYFSPLMSWPIFQAKAMIFRDPNLARYVDLPYGRGDLYYLQNLTAVLESD